MAWRIFDDEDLAAVKEVLDSGNLSAISGAQTPAFEQEFAAEFGAPHALAVTNAMAGLHCGVAAAGVQPGDEVIVDPIVSFATLGAMYHNGFPVYADVRRDTHLMDPDSLRERITERTKAVIVTNLWGLCADYDAINAIAREHDLVVIEDCAHAIYATYKGTYAGCNGDIGVYSFQMSKQMALGDAGMVVCKSEEHRRIMEEMTTFGTIPKRLGWNYRINEVVAAIGRVQLKRTRSYVDDCIEAADLYSQAVEGCEWIAPQAGPEGRVNTYHIWAMLFEGDKHGISEDDFRAAGEEEGFNVPHPYIGGKPAYLHDVLRVPLSHGPGCLAACPDHTPGAWYEPGLCPVAENIMPRLLLIGTAGGAEAHRQSAENLAATIERLS